MTTPLSISERIDLLENAVHSWLSLAQAEDWQWIDWTDKPEPSDPRRIIAAHDSEHPFGALYRHDRLEHGRVCEAFSKKDCDLAILVEQRLAEHGPCLAAWLTEQQLPEASALAPALFLARRTPEAAERVLRVLVAARILLWRGQGGIEQGQNGREESPFKFEREGDVWRLQFGEERGTFNNSKGLHYFARLLDKPNNSIDALDLEGIDRTRIPRQQTDTDILTEEMKADYKQRLDEIYRGKAIAANSGNDGEYERLEKEGEAILEQLKKAAGATGKSRKLQAGNEAVKSHDRIEKALKAVRKKLTQTMPKLADHFDKTIKSEGVSFAYRPGDSPPDWKISH